MLKAWLLRLFWEALDRLAVARRSGWEGVLPHRGMFPRRQALPHQACSRCLIDPPAEPQLLF